jgi:hypothetical protein
MTTHIDLSDLQDLIEQGTQAQELRELVLAHVRNLQTELDAIEALLQPGKGKRRPSRTADAPAPGTAPEKICRVMSPTVPMQVSEISEKSGISEGTCKVYLSRFRCFESVGRGKGYICTASPEHPDPDAK